MPQPLRRAHRPRQHPGAAAVAVGWAARVPAAARGPRPAAGHAAPGGRAVAPMTAALSLPPASCFIDNVFTEPQRSEVDVVLNPATEAELGRVPAADERTVDDAIAAARRAADTWHWAELTPRVRSDALDQL